MIIGVFDSGVGGKSFVTALTSRFPLADIVYKEDAENLPYGTKSPTELLELTTPIFQEFEDEGCDAVLVACNTLTTNCITQLRESVQIPLVGVEPMIKPAAAMTQTKVIAVCATAGTLGSSRYGELKSKFADGIEVIEPDCSDWASMIEDSRHDEIKLKTMMDTLRQKRVDVVVLGCTHYHWIEKELKMFAGSDMKVIQPIEPVLDQLGRIVTSN